MTMALCFNCGHTKFGAIVPCSECNVASTGDMNLDIAFSDHHMSTATIGAFGEVIRALSRVCDDRQLCFWSFIRFVSLHHTDILSVGLLPDQQSACDAVLAKANPPPVVVEESERGRFMRELQESVGEDAGAEGPPGD